MKGDKKTDDDLVLALEFLQKTKDGKYSKIDKSSLQFVRIADIIDFYSEEDLYYYSVS